MRLTPIAASETILDVIAAKLAAMESGSGKRFSQVEKFPGTSAEALLEFLPALNLPAAALIYSGSSYANRPLRTVRVQIAVLVDMYKADDKENLRAQIDAVVQALDDQVSGRALIQVEEDRALELPGNPALAASLISLKIQDH